MAHHARMMANAGHDVRILAGRGAQIAPAIPFVKISLADSRHSEVIAFKTELDEGRIPERFNRAVDQLSTSLEKTLLGVDVLVAHNVCSLHKNLLLTAALKQRFDNPGSPRNYLAPRSGMDNTSLPG